MRQKLLCHCSPVLINFPFKCLRFSITVFLSPLLHYLYRCLNFYEALQISVAYLSHLATYFMEFSGCNICVIDQTS